MNPWTKNGQTLPEKIKSHGRFYCSSSVITVVRGLIFNYIPHITQLIFNFLIFFLYTVIFILSLIRFISVKCQSSLWSIDHLVQLVQVDITFTFPLLTLQLNMLVLSAYFCYISLTISCINFCFFKFRTSFSYIYFTSRWSIFLVPTM